MTKIESKKVQADAPVQEVFNFLSDMNNIEKLLPPGKYSDFKSDTLSCTFKVQGAYNIGLKFYSSTPHTEIKYASSQGSPFPFTLNVHLEGVDGKTGAQMIAEAYINMFLEMMVKGPLKNLFDYMADQLTVIFKAA